MAPTETETRRRVFDFRSLPKILNINRAIIWSTVFFFGRPAGDKLRGLEKDGWMDGWMGVRLW